MPNIDPIQSTSRKETECASCSAKFWYIDPRPGGRPRKKCGVCSSRPPRYPWGFISPPASGWENEPALSEMYKNMSTEEAPAVQEAKVAKHRIGQSELPAALGSSWSDGVPMPSGNYGPALANSESGSLRVRPRSDSELDKDRIEQHLDDISRRLAELEMKVDSMRAQFTLRSDWVDLSARLDMVEHSMSETLNKVRGRLDTFSKEVRQIAVVPEKELGEMFELIRMIRRYLDNS